MAKLVVTAIGDDRAGLVSALSSAVSDAGGNWLEGQMARLGGKFAGIVLVDVPDDRRSDLEASVQALASEGLEVTLTETDVPVLPESTTYALSVVGNDRPGIVREFSSVLAGLGVGIEELHTSTREVPMGEGLLFEADSVIAVPEGVELRDVQRALEDIAHDLVVDLDSVEANEN